MCIYNIEKTIPNANQYTQIWMVYMIHLDMCCVSSGKE